MKIAKSGFKVILFITVFILIFTYLSELFCRKTIYGAWNCTYKTSGFYNEPENEFDIMYFGSSNTYCSINPLVFYDETKIKSYVFATQRQPVWATYTYIKEALKTQDLKLVVMDILMFSEDTEYYDDGVNYSFMDDIPLSRNKIELAAVSAPPRERTGLLINFMKYHSRWNELTKEDYEFDRSEVRDYLKGYVLMEELFTDGKAPVTDENAVLPLGEKEKLYFNKIVELLHREGIPLLLIKAPSNVTADVQKRFNAVKQLATENNIEFIDYNKQYEQIGLILTEDFCDKSHLNYKGAEKFTKYFAADIQSRYALPPSDDDNNTDSLWQNDLNTYRGHCANLSVQS